MSELFDKSLREVIEVSASAAPTPGGGSVSAIVASFGVAMASMVGNLTVGKEKYKDVEPQVQELLNETPALIARLESLVDEDMADFGHFMATLKMPKGTPEEKAARSESMQQALKRATNTPLEIARVCLKALEITDRLAPIGNKTAISDAGVAAVVAEAALNSVLLSVDINLPSIKDQDFVSTVAAERDRLVAEAARLKEKALATVRERMK